MKTKNYQVSVLVSVILCVFSLLISGVGGAPGTGTSITVLNSVKGGVSSSPWSYTIVELNPPKAAKPYTASFTLLDGGKYSFGGLRSGAYRVAEVPKFGYYAIMNITSNKVSGSQLVTGFEVTIILASSEGRTVAFTNYAMPAFSMTDLVVPPPDNLGLSIPPLTPIPVQSSLNVDVNNDGTLDLILGKPAVVFVNLAGLPFDIPISVSILFEQKVYNRVVQLSSSEPSNTVISFYSANNPIVPNNAGDEQITGIYQVNGGAQVALYTTNVTLKDTSGLSLYYAALTKSNYGSPSTFSETVQNSRDFINATYPVKNLTATVSSQSIAGSRPGTARDPYAGMLKDAQAVAQQAQLSMGGSAVGIAIAPNVTGLPDYFTYHGCPKGAVGVSFGPAVKGVIALDGYWTVPAHEVAHTFGLYYGEPEEYKLPGAPFPASGVWASAGAWKTGYSFMSAAQYKTTDWTWVNTDTTFEYLFSKTKVIPTDPQILLVNGIVYKDGTVEFPLDWVHMQEGTQDEIAPGDYLLRFVDIENQTTSNPISFGLNYSIQIDELGVAMNGTSVDTDLAGFSFAVPFPSLDTYAVDVVGPTGTVLARYIMSTVQSLSCSASLDGTQGLDDWYVSPVDVTITTMVDPTANQPYYVQEIHYRLDSGEEKIVNGSSAQLNITTDGIHSLEYWSVDNLGKACAGHTQTVKIDKSAPTISSWRTSENANGWNNGDVKVEFYASDTVSGLASYSGNTTLTSEGSMQSVSGSASDVAGNSAGLTVSGINIDKTPPTIHGAATTSPNTNGWYKTDVTVNFTASDSLSGIDTVTPDTTLTSEGAGQYVLGTAVDKAGNTATLNITDINIDKTPPTIIFAMPNDGVYYLGQIVTSAWSANDGISGLASANGAIDTSKVGTKVLVVTAIDNAGNTATEERTYYVYYVYNLLNGFLSPIPNSVYNLGRTIPVKFRLTDYQGNNVATAIAKIYVNQTGNYVPGVSKNTPGNTFNYDPASGLYYFNLDTTSLSAGPMNIKAELDDGTSITVSIILT